LIPSDAVVAGSARFVGALAPALAERMGQAPRVADSPHAAATLCQGGVGLLVYEHSGREWLPLCAELRRAGGPGVVIVVALPPEQAADVSDISASASAVVAWHGETRPVLEAALRVLRAHEAAAAAARRPVPVAPRPAATPPPLARAVPTPVPGPARPPPLVASPPVAPPARPEAEDPFANIFDEDPGAPSPAAEPLVAALAAEAVTGRAVAWPTSVLDGVDATAVLEAALSGRWPGPPLRKVTEELVGGLSDAETGALRGVDLPWDPAPLRQAAALRWKVAAALATLPPPGTPVDQEAVKSILAGIDQALAALKAVSGAAGPEAQRATENVRHALVKEAIDLTEALQLVLPAEAVKEITSSYKVPTPAPARTVGRTTFAPAESRAAERSQPWALVVVFALLLAAAGAYHGYRYVNRPRPAVSPVTGAPAGATASVSAGGKTVVLPAGQAADPVEIENFKNLERAKGNEVYEVMPGTFEVRPAGAPPPPGAPAARPAPAGGTP